MQDIYGAQSVKLCELCSKVISTKPTSLTKDCLLCGGAFDLIPQLILNATSKLTGIEWNSFSTSCKVPKQILIKQEQLWLINGLESSNHIKNIINRKTANDISKLTGKKRNQINPDILFVFDFCNRECKALIQPIFIFGHYKKHSRELSQSVWHCKKCYNKSRGSSIDCKRCGGRGVMYESVEGIISQHLIPIFECTKTAFHSSGREDVDVIMRGGGRPFAIELQTPRKRTADLKEIEKKINKDTRLKVSGLCFVSPYFVKVLCNSHFDKEYAAVVSVEGGATDADAKKVFSLSGKIISQKTPTRVLHRRADLERKRKIWVLSSFRRGNNLNIRIRAQAGTYIKELISSDSSRTVPSVSEILSKKAWIEKLDVIKIHDQFLRGVRKR
ncbi:MAG: tRNA pseudouridine(54/55) synthase Pus10 [Candidatus Anstonellales archaeon]